MSKEKVNKLIKEIKDLKVSELLEAFNGIIIILPNGDIFSSEDEKSDEEKPEQVLYDLILVSAGKSDAKVIKIIHEVTKIGLKAAKTMVDLSPQTVVEGVTKREVEALEKFLKQAGAIVKITQH